MNDLTHELAETLRELRTKFDTKQHLGPSMVRVDAALELYEDACKTPEETKMTDPHPITPPPELIKEWVREANHNEALFPQVAILAAQWGADQELKACCEFLDTPGEFETVAWNGKESDDLRAARRPKPPSKKEQALEALGRIDGWAVSQLKAYAIHDDLVRDVDFLRQLLQEINDD